LRRNPWSRTRKNGARTPDREARSCAWRRRSNEPIASTKFNTVNAASLARWIVMTAFLALAGLAYVYLTLQLYHLGERRKAVENELASLRTQNDIAAGQIAALTSRSALQRRLKEGYLKMIPVSDSKIVRLTVPAQSSDDDAIQPVVNPSNTK